MSALHSVYKTFLYLFKMHLKVTWLIDLLLLLSQMNLEMKVGIIIIIIIINNSFISIEPFIQKMQLKVLHRSRFQTFKLCFVAAVFHKVCARQIVCGCL